MAHYLGSVNRRTLQRVRVPLGFLFAIVFVVFARPAVWTLTAGSVIVLLGLAIRAWAAGHIQKARQLATTGPYAYTRNPLYLGSFIMGVGFTIASGVWWLAALFCVLFIGIYLPVMRVEAADMHDIFGSAYTDYAREVPAFVPRLTARQNAAAKFDPKLYFQYREHRAAIGALVALAALAAKAFFLGSI